MKQYQNNKQLENISLCYTTLWMISLDGFKYTNIISSYIHLLEISVKQTKEQTNK